jgi:hypothetical protein
MHCDQTTDSSRTEEFSSQNSGARTSRLRSSAPFWILTPGSWILCYIGSSDQHCHSGHCENFPHHEFHSLRVGSACTELAGYSVGRIRAREWLRSWLW